MAVGFPLYVDLNGNNCTVFGGGESAIRRVRELLLLGAKVTVISPTLCPALQELSNGGKIRHIPRKYYRGDCTNSQLCIAATNDSNTNIAIATECKAKSIPINVTNPKAYGNFRFPRVVVTDQVLLSVDGELSSEQLAALRDKLAAILPDLIRSVKE